MKVIKMPSSFELRNGSLKKTIILLIQLVIPKKKEIEIDFSKLETTTKGDIMVFLAQIEKSIIQNKNKFYRKGSLPKKKRIKEILLNSMDLDTIHVNKNISVTNLDKSERAKLLNPDKVDHAVKVLKKVGIKEYFTPINEFLTELIANAVEHGIENKNINWWLTYENDWKRKQIKYTFVDMGLGIISSHKKAGLPLKYTFLNNRHIVLDAFYARLGSSTKEAHRGRGLPQLKDMIEKGFVSNLRLITNNVSLHYKDDKFISSNNRNFIGTYYSWTIDKDCFSKWKN